MDIAYDHLTEQVATNKPEAASDSKQQEKQQEAQASINEDLQEAYKAISSSAWGAKIGGFFGNVVKQGESVYQTAQKELTTVGNGASRGFSDLRETIISHTRSLSITSPTTTTATATTRDVSGSATPTQDSDLLSRIKSEAAARLKAIQRAEDAADAALLQFGSNVRDFLKDAIKVAPASSSGAGEENRAVFESKDAAGKRVIHSTRFEAQLHVLHTNPETLLKAPEQSGSFEAWKVDFDVEAKTKDITGDLDKYPELRSTMEALVPEKVSYAEFWCRYYFLRYSIETAENRRKELLKAASANDDVSGWGDDSDSDSDDEASSKPTGKKPVTKATSDSDSDANSDSGSDSSDEEVVKGKSVPKRPVSAGSSRTIQVNKTAEGRKSNEGDSDTSYDLVGAASAAQSKASADEKRDDDSSEEEDWE